MSPPSYIWKRAQKQVLMYLLIYKKGKTDTDIHEYSFPEYSFHKYPVFKVISYSVLIFLSQNMDRFIWKLIFRINVI